MTNRPRTTHHHAARCRSHPNVRLLGRCPCGTDHGYTWVEHGTWCPGDALNPTPTPRTDHA